MSRRALKRPHASARARARYSKSPVPARATTTPARMPNRPVVGQSAQPRSAGCVGLLAPNGCCFCPNTFTHIQYIQIYSTLFDTILRRKWHIQSETHSHFFRILRHAVRASRAIRSRAHSGRTFMAFGRDTFRENLHLITFNLIPVACIHANSCWSHSCIF